jgi:hypothetical protein
MLGTIKEPGTYRLIRGYEETAGRYDTNYKYCLIR